MKKYDYIIVGAGLFGATFANLAKKDNKKVLVIDKRNHIAGNVFTENIEGVNVHKYGAHIFHTDYKDVWDYVNSKKVKIIDIDENVFAGNVVCITDAEESGADEDEIVIQSDIYTIIGFKQSEIKGIEDIK